MAYDDRKKIIQQIEKLRGGRALVSLCNFDRISVPDLPGVKTPLQADLKECLYRVLKETPSGKGIDVFLYTRGGDTNSVWPIASLLREFDRDFEVLVPFRAHSAGTMLALAAKRVVMTRLGELSPIDPTTGNQFNPIDPTNQKNRLAISVEDMRAYRDFVRYFVGGRSSDEELTTEEQSLLQSSLCKMGETVHPLALGNVHRVHQLVSGLAKKLLEFHVVKGRDPEKVVRALTVETYSHQHIIGRVDAKKILKTQVQMATRKLELALDKLLKKYVDDFGLRSPLFAARWMEPTEQEKEFRFIGGVLESRHWGYIFETTGKMMQQSKLPPNVNVQIPPGQPMPIVPGLPRDFSIEVHQQRWYRNTKPEGVTI